MCLTTLKREKTKEECLVTVTLLGNHWYYGEHAHAFFEYKAPKGTLGWPDNEPVGRFDADTWEPLTKEQVSVRMDWWREYGYDPTK